MTPRGLRVPRIERLRAASARSAIVSLALVAALLAGCGGVERDKERGAALIEAGQYAEAAPILEQVVAKRPQDLEALHSYALALTRAGDGNRAIEQWLRVLEKDPNSTDARYWLGIAYVSVDKVDQAVQQWVKVVEQDSTHISARYNLGLAYTKMGLFPLSVEEWSQVLLQDPTHFEARVNRGRILVAQGDLQRGLEDFLIAIAVKPEEAINWCSLGETYFLLGDSAKAVASIDSFLVKQVGLEDLAARAKKLREDIVSGRKPPPIEYRPFLFPTRVPSTKPQ
jgi:tetratricopeptide (TPR) repeat protein